MATTGSKSVVIEEEEETNQGIGEGEIQWSKSFSDHPGEHCQRF